MLLTDNTVFVPVKEPNLAEARTPSARLPMDRRLASFDEVEGVYTEEQALDEAARCLKCPTHWCANACPAGVPVTDFIAKVRARDYEGAYRIIRSASTLPEMCARVCPQEKQCQSNCTRGIRNQAVGIGRLERFVVERHYAGGGEEPRPAPTGKRAAVIGSGPAGLSAAQYLADRGHAVTVFERADRPGGLLEYGIPNMKLEKGVVERKIDAMRAQGVEFKTGVQVGVDVQAEALAAQYDAVILCVGAGNARSLALEGAQGVRGICGAVEFLTANTKSLLDSGLTDGRYIDPRGKQVVIVGGGDTGSDCVGTSLRHGCAGVTQIEMLPERPGRQVIYDPRPRRAPETKADSSLEECLAVFGRDPRVYQTTIKAVQADENGWIKSVTAVSLEPVLDAQRRLKMAEVPGTEHTLPCELLIVAVGFVGPCADVARAFGVETDGRSNFAAEGYATAAKGVFACGDCRTGQSLVVKAMADGRACAEAVHEFLR